MNINTKTLKDVVRKMLATEITAINYETTQLHGGTVGNVQLITGVAKTNAGDLPYQVAYKTSKKWERYGDLDSWRREYDLYSSALATQFTDSLRWPTCYHVELAEDEIQLYLEYIDGVTGLDLTPAMYEQAAYELGKFQGKLLAEQRASLQAMTNLSKVDYAKNFYYHYRSWPVVHDYIRSDNCEVPQHLCQMLIDFDDQSTAIFAQIEKLPVVLCHRDFWITNIFNAGGKTILIDWDTTGWGYLGEDLASLLADEADVPNMLENYRRCIPAYYKGFSEYQNVDKITDDCVYEFILALFGYRLIEWYLGAETPAEKELHIETLEQVYQMKDLGGNKNV